MMTILDSLYCEEENHLWEEEEDENEQQQVDNYTCLENNANSYINIISHQDLFWEDDDELTYLLSKEECQQRQLDGGEQRRMAVEWVMEVASHYSFATLTVVLAVNYLDRFLEKFDTKKLQQPWITQLTSVSCLSLAAKVEETHVPLLLDLQMDGSKYVFEGKTIQKMEILILSTLEWKMNPVTPLSFLDYITTRLGLTTNYLSLQFRQRCESLLLCLLPEERFKCYLPSVIATATMMHVINNIEPCIEIQYKSQLLGILGINKVEVEECWKEIQEITCGRNSGRIFNKRKFGFVPGSPDAVMDVSFSSDESWSVVNPSGPSSSELQVKKARKGAA